MTSACVALEGFGVEHPTFLEVVPLLSKRNPIYTRWLSQVRPAAKVLRLRYFLSSLSWRRRVMRFSKVRGSPDRGFGRNVNPWIARLRG